MVRSNTYGIHYAQNKEAAVAQATTLHTSSGSYLLSVMYPEPTSNPEQVDIIYQQMKLIDKTLTAKLSVLSLKEFNQEYEKSFALGVDALYKFNYLTIHTEINLNLARHAFFGCEILLMKYAVHFIHCPKKRSELIQKNSKTLYNHIILCLKEAKCPNSTVKIGCYEGLQDTLEKKALQRPAPIIITKETLPTPVREPSTEENKHHASTHPNRNCL